MELEEKPEPNDNTNQPTGIDFGENADLRSNHPPAKPGAFIM